MLYLRCIGYSQSRVNQRIIPLITAQIMLFIVNIFTATSGMKKVCGGRFHIYSV
jgi:hypothetical protein